MRQMLLGKMLMGCLTSCLTQMGSAGHGAGGGALHPGVELLRRSVDRRVKGWVGQRHSGHRVQQLQGIAGQAWPSSSGTHQWDPLLTSRGARNRRQDHLERAVGRDGEAGMESDRLDEIVVR